MLKSAALNRLLLAVVVAVISALVLSIDFYTLFHNSWFVLVGGAAGLCLGYAVYKL